MQRIRKHALTRATPAHCCLLPLSFSSPFILDWLPSGWVLQACKILCAVSFQDFFFFFYTPKTNTSELVAVSPSFEPHGSEKASLNRASFTIGSVTFIFPFLEIYRVLLGWDFTAPAICSVTWPPGEPRLWNLTQMSLSVHTGVFDTPEYNKQDVFTLKLVWGIDVIPGLYIHTRKNAPVLQYTLCGPYHQCRTSHFIFVPSFLLE